MLDVAELSSPGFALLCSRPPSALSSFGGGVGVMPLESATGYERSGDAAPACSQNTAGLLS